MGGRRIELTQGQPTVTFPACPPPAEIGKAEANESVKYESVKYIPVDWAAYYGGLCFRMPVYVCDLDRDEPLRSDLFGVLLYASN